MAPAAKRRTSKKASKVNRTIRTWTIGYEGRTFDQFLNVLKESRIKQVVDVREKPISRKNGFSKRALSEGLWKEMIVYCHIPQLGTPQALRTSLRNGGSIERLLDGYVRHLGKNAHAYELLRKLVSARASAILCFERDYIACHRQVLAARLEADGFRVGHL